MNIKERKKKFNEICQVTKSKKVTNLIASGKLINEDIVHLKETSKILLYSSLKLDKIFLDYDTDTIIKKLEEKKPKNITHNGLIVPKKENTLEYNLFLKSFLKLLKNKGFDKVIEYFISPPQLRIKFGNNKNKKNLNDSSHIHSDAWTNYNTDRSLTFYLPLFGDTKKNYVEFFKPVKKFENDWLKPKKFKFGKNIGKNYNIAKTKYEIGNYVLTDCAILHRSVIQNKAGPRISIDAAFIPKKNFNKKVLSSHIEFDKLKNVGINRFIIFKDSYADSLFKIKKLKRQSLQNRYFYNF